MRIVINDDKNIPLAAHGENLRGIRQCPYGVTVQVA
jgi:hypothetical protein